MSALQYSFSTGVGMSSKNTYRWLKASYYVDGVTLEPNGFELRSRTLGIQQGAF